MAPEGLDVLAQRGDLERMAGGDDGHRTVLDTGRHRLEAGRLDQADHLLRQRGRGHVDLADRLAEQRIAHRAADDARLLAGAVERGEQVAQRRLLEPWGIDATADLGHLVSPGTNRPSSVWAGT